MQIKISQVLTLASLVLSSVPLGSATALANVPGTLDKKIPDNLHFIMNVTSHETTDEHGLVKRACSRSCEQWEDARRVGASCYDAGHGNVDRGANLFESDNFIAANQGVDRQIHSNPNGAPINVYFRKNRVIVKEKLIFVLDNRNSNAASGCSIFSVLENNRFEANNVRLSFIIN